MGMTGGSFNTREFMHGKTLAFLSRHQVLRDRCGLRRAGDAAAAGPAGRRRDRAGGWLLLAVLVQSVGLLADRWYFFAQARHPQNLYYQIVS